MKQEKEYTHPSCFHVCSGNCRRVGCNCECGEFHGKLTFEEYQEVVSDLNAELAGAEKDGEDITFTIKLSPPHQAKP